MKSSRISRRKFLGAAAAATAVTVAQFNYSFSIGTQSKKPNSKVGGVQLGNITNSLARLTLDIDEFIGYLTTINISSIELRSFAEESLGLPRASQRMRPGATPAEAPGGQRQQMSGEEKTAMGKYAQELAAKQREWRLSLPLEKYAEMRKKFDTAGIKIHIVKFAPARWSDEEIDYAFKAAGILGAYGITDEAGVEACQRLGKFAEKHNSLAIYHTHGQFNQLDFDIDTLLKYSPANRLNFDAGHYFGSTGLHPNGIIEKYHDSIPSIHIKDKTSPKSNPPNTNMPFGKGETPIADILLLIKKEEWPINVDVEMEYPIPEGSDAVKEITKCIDYLRNILE